jgi:hypothetical protein
MAHGACPHCGNAYEECDSSCGPAEGKEILSTEGIARAANALLASIGARPTPRPAYRVGQWVRVTQAPLEGAEGRVESVGENWVSLRQLNGTLLVVPPAWIGRTGTTWERLASQ